MVRRVPSNFLSLCDTNLFLLPSHSNSVYLHTFSTLTASNTADFCSHGSPLTPTIIRSLRFRSATSKPGSCLTQRKLTLGTSSATITKMLWQPRPKVQIKPPSNKIELWQPASPSEVPTSPTSTTSGWSTGESADGRVRNPGRRFGQIIRLRKERAEEYKACHAKAWPEVLKQIKECKIEDCKCIPLNR